jgi:hypothetical protein
MKALAKMAEDNPELWPKMLPFAVLASNVTVNKRTGMSPFEIMHGYAPTWFVDHDYPIAARLYRDQIWEDWSTEDLLLFRLSQLVHATGLVEDVRGKLNVQRIQAKAAFDAQATPPSGIPGVGDIVMVANNALDKQWSNKLVRRYFGPYRVVEKATAGHYKLAELDGSAMLEAISGNRLKLLLRAGSPGSQSGRGHL